MKRVVRLVAGVCVFAFFIGAAERAAHFEQARGSVLTERAGVGGVEGASAKPGGIRNGIAGQEVGLAASARSESACGASSIGPGRTVPTVTSCESIPLTATRHQKKPLRWWVARARQNKRDANKRGQTITRLKRTLESAKTDVSPVVAIRLVFGSYADQALQVAWCESRYDIGAENGQYLGLFQMGRFARSTYGHSYTALGQAQAAYRYFVASGRDWSPWECRP